MAEDHYCMLPVKGQMIPHENDSTVHFSPTTVSVPTSPDDVSFSRHEMDVNF